MFSSWAPKQAEKLWNPDEVLEITNPDTGSATCLGYAKTCNRRCQRHIALSRTNTVFRILDEVAEQDAALAAADPDRLAEAIRTGLCWQHTGNLGMVLRQWVYKLQKLQPCAPPPISPGGQTKAYRFNWVCGNPGSHPTPTSSLFFGNAQNSHPATSFGATLKREPQDPSFPGGGLGSVPPYHPATPQQPAPRRDGLGVKTEDASDAMLEEMRKKQEEIEELKKIIEDMRRRAREDDEEQKREERRAREARRRQEEEQRRQEEEQRRRQEREERERRERERREREKREENERMRERARTRAQERLRVERLEWANAWSRYAGRWEDIQGKSMDEVNADEIPWPVKSGKWGDVNSANVKAFFEKAPPVRTDADAAEERFLSMTKESKRWHTDKILSQFGAGVLSGKYKDDLNMIAKLVVEMWRQAKQQRRR